MGRIGAVPWDWVFGCCASGMAVSRLALAWPLLCVCWLELWTPEEPCGSCLVCARVSLKGPLSVCGLVALVATWGMAPCSVHGLFGVSLSGDVAATVDS